MSDIAGPTTPDTFADCYEATKYLTAPAKPKAIPDPRGPMALLDVVSPAAWVTEFLKEMFDYDPLEEFTKYFAGDWSVYAKCGEAYNKIGQCLADVGGNINHGNKKLEALWEGNAAESAHEYFKSIGKVLSQKDHELSEIAHQYDHAARSVWHTAELASDIIGAIFDAAAIAAVAAVAGTVTAESGVGAAVGYGVAALEMANIAAKIGELTKVYSAGVRAVHLAAGAIEGTLAGTGEIRFTSMPCGSYHHPAS